MKKTILTLALLALPVCCGASYTPGDWKYYKEITVSQPAALEKFVIDDEIFNNAKSDLSDLRIIDRQGKEIPYQMVVSRNQASQSSCRPVILNNAYLPGQFTTAIVNIKSGQTTNRLRIITPTENFQRNVKIYGSDDKTDWLVLNDQAYIYDYTDKKGGVKAQDTTVTFPDSLYKYLKIEIADENDSPVRISSLEAVNYIKEYSKELERRPKFTVTENSELRSSDIMIDLGAKGIPTDKVRLAIRSDNFKRGLQVFTSNNGNDWAFLTDSYIFRYQTPKFSGENLQVNFPETNSRYLKLRVNNKDDLALPISGVITYSNYREISFLAETGQDYQIFYGNTKAAFPEYDLDAYFQYLDSDNAQIATLSAQQNNSRYVPEKIPQPPLSERVPYLLPVSLSIACLLLLLMIFKFFKKK